MKICCLGFLKGSKPIESFTSLTRIWAPRSWGRVKCWSNISWFLQSPSSLTKSKLPVSDCFITPRNIRVNPICQIKREEALLNWVLHQNWPNRFWQNFSGHHHQTARTMYGLARDLWRSTFKKSCPIFLWKLEKDIWRSQIYADDAGRALSFLFTPTG